MAKIKIDSEALRMLDDLKAQCVRDFQQARASGAVEGNGDVTDVTLMRAVMQIAAKKYESPMSAEVLRNLRHFI